VTSGIRIGTAAMTTRGMKDAEMMRIADWFAEVLTAPTDDAVARRVASQVRELCDAFPLYPQLRREHAVA
jgi:glycine hydroxymethyltransferase